MRETRINSRSKGRAFEQTIARDLRSALGPAYTVSRATTDQQRDQGKAGHAGEFIIVGPVRFPFAIECKAVETFHEGHLWRPVVPDVTAKLWRQAVRQAEAAGLEPMLIVKRNGGSELVVMGQYVGPMFMDYLPAVRMTACISGEYVMVYRWETVLASGLWGHLSDVNAAMRKGGAK